MSSRKSSEDGLEQEFNALDAQREACAAYITSQEQEGWVLLPQDFDHAGMSGDSLDWLALQKLLQDGAAKGRVARQRSSDPGIASSSLLRQVIG